MSTSWAKQKQLAFNTSYIDYITCTHYVALPSSSSSSSSLTEVLYLGCNNGSVVACNISNLANSTTSADTSLDVSTKSPSSLSLLYRHGTTATPSSNNNNSKKNNDGTKSPLAVNDEISGSSIFALCHYETLFASCADDRRCVITMMSESHSPFTGIHKNNTSANRQNQDQNNYQHHHIISLSTPPVAVIEESAPIRSVTLFGGKKSWERFFESDKKIAEQEESSVYCATGGEDGFIRVYRINVGFYFEHLNQVSLDFVNDMSSLFSFSHWTEKTSPAIQLIWVTSMAHPCCGNRTINNGIMAPSQQSLITPLDDDVMEIKYFGEDDDDDNKSSDNSRRNGGNHNQQSSSFSSAPFICSIIFDEDNTELFLVGTQSGVCVCDCLPKHPSHRGKELRDLTGSTKSWMNASVWCLDGETLKTMKKSANESLVPLRSLKPKYLNRYQCGRSIGTVIDQTTSNNDDDEARKGTTMIKVMFPNITILESNSKSSNATHDASSGLMLPIEAMRRLGRPKYFLTTSGGPYFAIAIVGKNNEKDNNNVTAGENSKKEMICAVAGAATSGEVLVFKISSISQNTSSSEDDATLTLLCRFRAAKDLIKHIISLTTNKENLLMFLCGSYDGTLSEWMLAGDEENGENNVMVPMRRCVQLVSSADSKVQHERELGTWKLSFDSLSRYPNLLSSKNDDDDDDNDDEASDNHHAKSPSSYSADLEISSSTGVGAMHYFREAGVLFASCLFDRTVQTFIFSRNEGPFDLPMGMIFNGYRTVAVEMTEDCGDSVAGVPPELETVAFV